MRRIFVIFLITMSLSLVGCGSKNSETNHDDTTQAGEAQTKQRETETITTETQTDSSKVDVAGEAELDFSKYAGKYLCVEYVNSDGRDDSELLKSQWEDKSHYSYYEITEDGDFILTYVDGEKETVFPTFRIVSIDGDSYTLTSGEAFRFEDEKMVFEFGPVARTVWVKTDEIPDSHK